MNNEHIQQNMYTTRPRRPHTPTSMRSSSRASSTTSSPPPSPPLKPRYRSTVPEKYPFTSIPLLFYVALSLIILACCRQPTSSTRPFVTTRHVYPLSCNDSAVAPPNTYWAARYLGVPSHMTANAATRRWKAAVVAGIERISRVSKEVAVRRGQLRADASRVRTWFMSTVESIHAARAAMTNNVNNDNVQYNSAAVPSQASSLLPGKGAQEVMFKTALAVGVVLMLVVLSAL